MPFSNQKHSSWQNKLDNHSTPLPPELSWDAIGGKIEQQVPRKNKRKPFLVFLLIIGLLASGFLYNALDKNIADTVRETNTAPVEAEESKLDKNSVKPIAQADPSLIASVSHRVEDKRKIGLQSLNHQPLPLPIKINSSSPKPDKHSTDSLTNTMPNQVADNVDKLPSLSGIVYALPRQFLVATLTTASLAAQVSLNETTLPLVDHSPVSGDISDGPSQDAWSIEFVGGANKSVVDYNDENNISADNEDRLVGYQWGMRLNKTLNERWSVGIGFGRQVWRSKSAAENSVETTLYRPNTVDSIFTNTITGEERIVYTDSVPGIRIDRFRNYNRQNRWEFQLGIQHHLALSNTLQMETGLGFYAAIRQAYRGSVWTVDDRIVAIPQDQQIQNNFGIVLHGGLSIQMSKKLQLISRGSWRRDLNQSSLANHEISNGPLNGKYRLGAMSAELGVRWNW